jgi:hypothetical protein
MEIRPTVGLAISRKPPKVAQYLARNPDSASQPNAVADMSLSALGHDTQLVDFVTAFPQHRRHKLSTTKNGVLLSLLQKQRTRSIGRALICRLPVFTLLLLQPSFRMGLWANPDRS